MGALTENHELTVNGNGGNEIYQTRLEAKQIGDDKTTCQGKKKTQNNCKGKGEHDTTAYRKKQYYEE